MVLCRTENMHLHYHALQQVFKMPDGRGGKEGMLYVHCIPQRTKCCNAHLSICLAPLGVYIGKNIALEAIEGSSR